MPAFAYTAPISALIRLCDREPEKNGGCDEAGRSFQQALYQNMDFMTFGYSEEEIREMME